MTVSPPPECRPCRIRLEPCPCLRHLNPTGALALVQVLERPFQEAHQGRSAATVVLFHHPLEAVQKAEARAEGGQLVEVQKAEARAEGHRLEAVQKASARDAED